MGNFRNLERLTVHEYAQKRFMKLVNESATSKLTELIMMREYPQPLASETDRIFKHLRRLETLCQLPASGLPPTLVELRTRYIPEGSYPYIESLSVTGLNFLYALDRHSYSFPNLASLTLSLGGFLPSLSVTLPNLISLVVYGSEYHQLACLSAPKLHRLVVQPSWPNPDKAYDRRVDTLTAALTQDSFSLSPTAELELGSPLHPTETLDLALSRMSQARRVILNVADVEKEWLDVVILLTKVNTGLVLRGSALLTDTLVLKPKKIMHRLNSAAGRLMAAEILGNLRSTGIQALEISTKDGFNLEMSREDT